ncbi:putative oxidoreductase [Stella humosa]|uniref:Putative oxidoreductase n=1 Tax=Stella humosa TaxID=94 RepID=A0A3N1KGY1_9PROT|nr:malate/lactate/ureidoglycolate dehydrogenase [Stella humosa]ROP80813.1 putative oxidoreductase [Stella humosa]BBK33396.1 malate/lactate/ureidoglycolate dehydrogenase [Stella humosa]
MPAIAALPLRRVVAAIFTAAGCDPDEAGTIARCLVEANLAGHDSHGVARVQRYIRALSAGMIERNRHATVALDSGSLVVLEGHRGFGQVIGAEAMAIAVARAKANGTAIVAIRRSYHLGRIGEWAEICAAAGCASIHFVNVIGDGYCVAPFGGAERRLSTNPFAAGMPVAGGDPIILDMATSSLAEGKVLVARNKGVPLPPGTIIDAEARPSCDPNALYGPPPGALLPFGAHKGYGLAVFCDLLAGVLTGGGCNEPGNDAAPGVLNNMLSIVLDVERFRDGDGAAREVEAFADWLRSSRPMEGHADVQVPGDPERRTRLARKAGGIPLDPTTWQTIIEAGAAVGLSDAEIGRLAA